MAIASGSRLGPYEVLNPIGAGGMGEVYRAKDTRLDRTVAIKVLPLHLSADPERRQRFEREARAVSALNHPHICTLYDVGNQDGIDFLVMEYIEGDTLAARLGKGALPLPDLLRYSKQIADALDKAHKQGIIHRDLKPANIILTKTGIKLLDFGLAKMQKEAAGQNVSAVATEQRDLTQEGTIIGTVQYMAPEQLEGKPVDPRTDIFAFGTVLYEMATGRKAFEGSSQASVIAAILKDQPPPPGEIQPALPALLQRLIQNCMAKDPDDRWQTAHDLLLQLQSIEESSGTATASSVVPRRNRRELIAWILTGIFLLLSAYLLFFQQKSEAPRAPIRVSILAPTDANLDDEFAISPDSRKIAFVSAKKNGTTLLWLRDLDSLEARALSGTEGASFPFWSPAGRYIGFFAQSKLKIFDTTGGAPQIICDALQGRGATWNDRDQILFAPFTASPLYLVSPRGGGTPKQITKLNAPNETGHRFPHFLPDSNHFLYVSDGVPRTVGLGSLQGETRRILEDVGSEAIYAAGRVYFVQNGTLQSQVFDPKTLRFSGERQKLAYELAWNNPYGFGAFSVSQQGMIAYMTAASPLTQLVWYDRSGARIAAFTEPGEDSEPALSNDGEKLAFFRNDVKTATNDVWIGDVRSNTVTRFTFDPIKERSPVWSPDNHSLLYVTVTGGGKPDRLMQKNLDGTGLREIAKGIPALSAPTDWSRDGKFVSYILSTPIHRDDIYIIDMSNPQNLIPFADTKFNETDAQFSPDARYLAYSSDESGVSEVYVQAFPQTGAKWQISTQGGRDPHWRGDGKELFYAANDGKLMAVSIDTGSGFHPGPPRPLFAARLAPGDVRSSYAVSPNGQRFLLTNIASEEKPPTITLLLDR